MTKNRDQKRLIRERMKKTGESFTAARQQLFGQQPASRVADATEVDVLGLGTLAQARDAANRRGGIFIHPQGTRYAFQLTRGESAFKGRGGSFVLHRFELSGPREDATITAAASTIIQGIHAQAFRRGLNNLVEPPQIEPVLKRPATDPAPDVADLLSMLDSLDVAITANELEIPSTRRLAEAWYEFVDVRGLGVPALEVLDVADELRRKGDYTTAARLEHLVDLVEERSP